MKTPKTSLQPYVYYATVTAVHDGDTFQVDLDYGDHMWQKAVEIRLNGCNAAELASPGGADAQAALAAYLPVGTVVLLQSLAPDKFGTRKDADVYLLDAAGRPLPGGNLVTLLIAQGWLAPWNGTGPKPVPAWPRVPAA